MIKEDMGMIWEEYEKNLRRIWEENENNMVNRKGIDKNMIKEE
jgi:hypothetical protein